MSENLRLYVHGLYTFDAVVQRTEPTRLDRPTPCAEWDAAAVIEHGAFLAAMVSDLARGLDVAVRGAPGDGLRPAPGGDDLRIASRLRAPRLESSDPIRFWNSHRDEVLEALDSPGAIRRVALSLWGHVTVDDFLGFAFYDAFIHAWDLGTAVGVDPVLDPTFAETAFSALEREGERMRQPRILGEPVEVDSDDPVTRLLALSGRDPSVG